MGQSAPPLPPHLPREVGTQPGSPQRPCCFSPAWRLSKEPHFALFSNFREILCLVQVGSCCLAISGGAVSGSFRRRNSGLGLGNGFHPAKSVNSHMCPPSASPGSFQMAANRLLSKQTPHHFITFIAGKGFDLQNSARTSLIRLEGLVWPYLEPTRRVENKFRTEP